MAAFANEVFSRFCFDIVNRSFVATGSVQAGKVLDLQDYLKKSLKIKFALKST